MVAHFIFLLFCGWKMQTKWECIAPPVKGQEVAHYTCIKTK